MESNKSMEILSINPERLKLSTLNDDCKELIFEFLDLVDLVQVAESNKQLNKAASAVFKRKYGNKGIVIGRAHRYMSFV